VSVFFLGLLPFFVAWEVLSSCMCLFNLLYESRSINDHNNRSWSFLWCFYVQIEHHVWLR